MTNCPPVYRNLQCESFNNKRKITSQMMRQLCKNDAYLYEQVMALWDATDPQSRKRFYPPYYMDIGRSFGIESTIISDKLELKYFKHFNEIYHFNNVEKYNYKFDFDGKYDKIGKSYADGVKLCMDIEADSLLDLENNHNLSMLEIVNGKLRPVLTENSYDETIHHNATYTPCKQLVTPATKGKYVTEKEEKLGKAKRDAYFLGAFKDWHCNNHWYNGYDRSKNYNVKSGWKKDPFNEDKDITKKYGRIPSVCHAQTFKAQSNGRISKVNLNIQGSKSAVSPCVVEIRTTNANGTPTQTVLARVEKKFTSTGNHTVAFDFTTKAEVKKGTTYAIVIRSPLSKFENTYRIGGWTVGCFSSEKKYYNDGSAYTSMDNGKTWKKNGKTSDTKSYGAHYYDWGINQKPIDFAFEVYVQPITQKSVKKYVKGTNAVYKTYNKLKKEAYDEIHTYSYNYFKEGSYYLHLKPIHVSPIDAFTIQDYFSDNTNDSEYWTWEWYNQRTSNWEEVSGRVDLNNNTTNYSVLMLRIRCDVTQSTFGEVLSVTGVSEIDRAEVQNLITNGKLSETGLTYLDRTVLTIECRKPTTAYLRTQYYHPPQSQMLGASIWSEVNVLADVKGDAELNIDIIHERESVEHFKFYDLAMIESLDISSTSAMEETMFSLESVEVLVILSELINEFNNSNDTYSTGEEVINFIYNNFINDGGFIEFLQEQITPIYILPYLMTGNQKFTYFFNRVKLAHLPSYPLIGGDVGDNDIIIDTNKITNVSEHGGCYALPYDITKSLSSINVTYDVEVETNNDTLTITHESENNDALTEDITETYVLDEDGHEVSVSERQERIKEKLVGVILENTTLDDVLNEGMVKNLVFNDGTGVNDTSIDYALTSDGKTLIFNFESKLMELLFPTPTVTTELPNSINGEIFNNLQIKIDLASETYQEFVDFEVDYDNGELEFYNPLHIRHGDFKVTYNPLWVRGLSFADFPLVMDLWVERYVIAEKGVYKLRLNTTNEEWVKGVFYEKTNIDPFTKMKDVGNKAYYQFKTTVPPLDNIRKLVVNENNDDGGEVLEEDSQFFVDYNTSTITLYIGDNYFNEGDIITVHYTPNLTDNGLALGYRLKRPRRDGSNIIMGDDDLNYDPVISDDVYLGMNSFTYRT